MRKHKAAQILTAIDAVYPDAVKVRREIHRNPELSGQEVETAALVHRRLSSLGLKPRYHVQKTGVVGRIRNGNGPVVVLRADLDALPLEEKTAVSYRSRRPGVMHACGHDMHTAALLGAADSLVKLRDIWRGTIVLLFQPSEEVEPGGALAMIEEGAFPEHTDTAFGLHVSTDCTTGQVALKSDVYSSAVLTFDVVVKGRGGHGAYPHTTVDPIVCAASMIMNLQTLVSRECPAQEAAVLTVGALHAGTKRNVIPDKAVFHGTIRTLSETLQNHLRRRVDRCLRHIAKSFGAELKLHFEKSYPAGLNDPVLTARARECLTQLLGARNVVTQARASMGAEDFTYYQQKAPGLYVNVGVRKPGLRTTAGIHSPSFLPDEKALRTAIAVYVALAIDACAARDQV